jgi:hypothetical protein
MLKAFLEMTPAEIEAWNRENGLTEYDDDFRYPHCGMTFEEIWIATGGGTSDHQIGLAELNPDELARMVMIQGMISTKH